MENNVSLACKNCENYGFGCSRPMTTGEILEDVQFYAEVRIVYGIGPVPDCFEKDLEE